MRKWAVRGMWVVSTVICWNAFVKTSRRSKYGKPTAFLAPPDSNTGRLRQEMEKSGTPQQMSLALQRSLERIAYRLAEARNGTAKEALAVTIADTSQTLENIEERLHQIRWCRERKETVRRLRGVKVDFEALQLESRTKIAA